MRTVFRALVPMACALAAFALTLSPHAPTARAQVATGVIRVAPGGSDVGGCGSAAQPCASIQFAVDQAANFDDPSRFQPIDIRVAEGTYTGGSANVVLLARSGTISVRGGFSTGDWNVSDPTANVTTIDGQDARRGVYIIVAAGTPCNVTLSGFTITRGRSSANDPFGGGVLVDNCTVSLSDLTVTSSRALGSDVGDAGPTTPGAGGGIALRGARNALLNGGAFDTTATLRNIVLRDNVAQGGAGTAASLRAGLGAGGGLYAIQAAVQASNVTSSNNTARGGNAPGSPGVGADFQQADGLGGGVGLIFSSFSLTGFQVSGNTAQGGDAGGKGGLALGGAAFIEQSIGTIANSTMSGNTARGGTSSSNNGSGGAALGGGLFSTDNDLTLDNVTLNENTALGNNATGTGGTAGDGGGGGIYLTKAPSTARSLFKGRNIVLAGNSISTGTGAKQGIAFGGGIFCSSTQMTLDHATLAANRLAGPDIRRGPAIALIGFSPTTSCPSTIRNSIVADHGAEYSPVYANSNAGTSTFSNNLWSGNKAPNIENEFNQPITDQGAMTGSPNFASPGAPNFDYHLTPGSAAIDKAVGSTLTADLDGQRRPSGAAADVGADEYSTQIVASATTSGDTITITWRRPPVLPLTGYAVTYTKEAGAGDAQQPSPITGIAADTTSFTLTGLTRGKTYTVTLVAREGGNQVGASDTFTVRAGGFQVYLPLVAR